MENMDEKIFEEPRKSFMEIMKVHNKEVPFANLLAFFFNPKEKHEFGVLFIEALLNTKCSELESQNKDLNNNLLKSNGIGFDNIENIIGENVKVEVEVSTNEEVDNRTKQSDTENEDLSELDLNKKRIDILIDAENFVICIEFKINHELNNPLGVYKKFIDDNYKGKRKYYVVLTPNRKECIGDAKNHNEFKQIILSHFIKNVKEKLQKLYPTYENENIYFKYYLKDFIQTVENRRIHSKRHEAFTVLKLGINEKIKPINCELHKKEFLEIKMKNFNLKIRIETLHWQIEKWTEKEKFILKRSKDYNVIIQEVEKIINETISYQSVKNKNVST